MATVQPLTTDSSSQVNGTAKLTASPVAAYLVLCPTWCGSFASDSLSQERPFSEPGSNSVGGERGNPSCREHAVTALL